MSKQTPTETQSIIWATVAQIPFGKVATYGQIAKLSGFPRGARQVGYALKQLSPSSDIPWHRVVNSRGTLSFSENSDKFNRQKQKLEQEGILFNGTLINLRQFQWRPHNQQNPSG